MSTLASVNGRGVNASRPAAGIAGQLYLSTDIGPGTWYRDNGSSWDAMAFTNPLTTAGDTMYGGASGVPTRLPAGAAGTVYKGGTTPSWGTPGEFAASGASVATSETTTSTSFADLATSGPSVTVTVVASGKVWATVYAAMANSGANDCFLGIVISGATTVAAATQLSHNGTTTFRGGVRRLLSGLNAGSTTFKLQYAVSAGTGTFVVRELTIEPFI